MKLTTAFATALIIVLLGVMSQLARAQQDTTSAEDVPHLPPVTSTAFVCDKGAKNQVVAVIVSYSNAQVLRWDAWHMHGFTVSQLMVYHDSAPDSRIYIVPCKSPEVT
jgi:hypothetical protein